MRRPVPPHRPGRDRWLVPYADLITLLFATFAAVAVSAGAPARTELTPPPPDAALEAQPAAAHATAAPPQADPGRPSLRSLVEPVLSGAPGSGIEILEDARGLVISLPESAAFPPASAVMTEGARDLLSKLAGALRPVDAAIRVEGHTDNVPIAGGRYASNWELSTARAGAVVLYLIEQGHLEPWRLSAAGYGEYHPRAGNGTPEERARNRRVDLVVTRRGGGAVPDGSAP